MCSTLLPPRSPPVLSSPVPLLPPSRRECTPVTQGSSEVHTLPLLSTSDSVGPSSHHVDYLPFCALRGHYLKSRLRDETLTRQKDTFRRGGVTREQLIEHEDSISTSAHKLPREVCQEAHPTRGQKARPSRYSSSGHCTV